MECDCCCVAPHAKCFLLFHNIVTSQCLEVFCFKPANLTHSFFRRPPSLSHSCTMLKITKITKITGEGQRTVIKLKLDSMADSVSGQTVIDPKGYLTDLTSMNITSSSEISDIKKVRVCRGVCVEERGKSGCVCGRVMESEGVREWVRGRTSGGSEECV